MNGFHAVTAVTISGAFSFGIVLALLGSIKLSLARRLEISETQIGWLLSALNLALLPMVLLSGVLIDQLGVRTVMILGSILTCVAIYGLTLRKSYVWAIGAVLLAGLGAACINTASVVLMPRAFFSEQADQVGAALNLGMAFIALGALVMPALVELLFRRLSFNRSLAVVALLCLVPALLSIIFPIDKGAHRGSLGDVLQNHYLWLAGLVFFLYAPLEATVGMWATTYLMELGVSERRAVWLLSGFWLTFLASRLGAAYLHIQASSWVIVALAILAAVVLGNLASASIRKRAPLELLLLGAILGPIFPTLVALVFRRFDPHGSDPSQWGTAYGALFAIGSASTLAACPVIGFCVRRRAVQHTLHIPMFIAIAMACAALVLGLQ